jgi:TolB-like protein/DNA-binding winged helix-turn-helix (wHTH) protein/tetratricopeptide (TPR) repeat protein
VDEGGKLWPRTILFSMAAPHNSLSLVRFGPFTADLQSGELWKEGVRIRLQIQPFQILKVFLERPGQLITREELQRQVWPSDTFVDFEQGLNKAINKLRDALCDNADAPQFIETVPKRGYRFIAPVIHAADVPEPGIAAAPQREPHRFRRRGRWLLAIGSLSVVVSIALLGSKLQSRPPKVQALVVLPFDNLSGDLSQGYLVAGAREALITELSKLQNVRVIALSDKEEKRGLAQLESDLGVDAVVEGSLIRSGNRIRVSARLVRISNQQTVWADSYEGEVGELLALQKAAARSITAEIRGKLVPSDAKAHPDPTPASSDLYLLGRHSWNKRNGPDLAKAVAYFEQAIAKDPNNALAYVGLADAYSVLPEFSSVPESSAFPRAKAAARKALAIDETLAEAHNSLAFSLFWLDHDAAAANEEFEVAILRSPSYATAQQWYGNVLMAEGRKEEAINHLRKARDLDPVSPIIRTELAANLFYVHRDDEAAELLQGVIQSHEEFYVAHYWLSRIYVEQKRFDDAKRELEIARSLSGRTDTFLAEFAYLDGRNGDIRAAQQLLAQFKRGSHIGGYFYKLGMIYAGMNDGDHAVQALEAAVRDSTNTGRFTDVAYMGVDPVFNSLRDNKPFQALLTKASAH